MTTQPLEWQPLWDAMDANPDAWIPTIESMYWEMLCVLPPIAMRYDSFLVGEVSRHVNGEAVYACFCKTGDNYRARHLTVSQFNQYTT
jgi:hypothetical protein